MKIRFARPFALGLLAAQTLLIPQLRAVIAGLPGSLLNRPLSLTVKWVKTMV